MVSQTEKQTANQAISSAYLLMPLVDARADYQQRNQMIDYLEMLLQFYKGLNSPFVKDNMDPGLNMMNSRYPALKNERSMPVYDLEKLMDLGYSKN
jgi:hypothetical protein